MTADERAAWYMFTSPTNEPPWYVNGRPNWIVRYDGPVLHRPGEMRFASYVHRSHGHRRLIPCEWHPMHHDRGAASTHHAGRRSWPLRHANIVWLTGLRGTVWYA